MAARQTLLVAGIVAALITPRESSAQRFGTEEGHAAFTSRVPLHTFTGKSDQLVGQINLADSTVDFYVDLTTLESGIGKRDKDMRRTLETDEFPFAEFYGKLVTPLDLDRQTRQEVTVRGAFTIHGVARDVEIEGSITPQPEGLRVVASWNLNLIDHDIVPPKLLIVKVDEIQALRIDAILTPIP